MRSLSKLLLPLMAFSFYNLGTYAKVTDNGGYEYDIEKDSIFYTIHEDGLYVSAQSVVVIKSYLCVNYPELTYWEQPDFPKIKTTYYGEIVIPENVAVGDTVYKVVGIDQFAFFRCLDLTGLIIPESVIHLERYCMGECSALKELNMAGKASALPNHIFYHCSSIEKIQLPGSIKSIGESAFSGCSSINNLVMPDQLETIGKYAFYGCSSLEYMDIPDYVETISDYAFYGCSSLGQFEIPDNVTTIGEYAFENCSGLTDIKIGNSVSIIKNFAFSGCKSLRSIVLPDNVTTLGDYFIYGCTDLEEIVIPEGVIIDNPEKLLLNGESYAIGSYNFCAEKADKLRYLNYKNHFMMDGETRTYFRKGLDVMRYMPSEIHEYASGSMECQFAPDVDSIPKRFWQDNWIEGMASLSIPSTVKYIGESAFHGCSYLTLVNIEGNPEIEEYTFGECEGIKRIVISCDTPPEYNNTLSLISQAEADAWDSSLSQLALLDRTVPIEGASGGYASHFNGLDGAFNWKIAYQIDYAIPGWYDVKVKVVPNAMFPEIGGYEQGNEVKPALLSVKVKYTDQDGNKQDYRRREPSNSRKPFTYVIEGDTIMTLDAARLYFGDMKQAGEKQLVTVLVKSNVTNSNRNLYSGEVVIDCISLELVSVTDPSAVEDVYSDLELFTQEREQIVSDSIRHIMLSEIFDDNVYSEAELIVPEGALDDYMKSEIWSQFKQLSGFNPTGISAASESKLNEIHYGIDGRLVAPEVPGFHIIRMPDGRIRKVYVPLER
ncbi:MAG: leucine-rich repeat domain-containing protein [Bacteroidaceae bacterium]|nr:leucine-rich repeat domain-containing protein [Bacteroidaceae bacterium]